MPSFGHAMAVVRPVAKIAFQREKRQYPLLPLRMCSSLRGTTESIRLPYRARVRGYLLGVSVLLRQRCIGMRASLPAAEQTELLHSLQGLNVLAPPLDLVGFRQICIHQVLEAAGYSGEVL